MISEAYLASPSRGGEAEDDVKETSFVPTPQSGSARVSHDAARCAHAPAHSRPAAIRNGAARLPQCDASELPIVRRRAFKNALPERLACGNPPLCFFVSAKHRPAAAWRLRSAVRIGGGGGGNFFLFLSAL